MYMNVYGCATCQLHDNVGQEKLQISLIFTVFCYIKVSDYQL